MSNLTTKDDDYYENRRTEMLRYVNGSPRAILEVGCGAGIFAQNFTDAEYWGVEPNETMAAKAAATCTKVFAATYEAAAGQIPDGHFDLVVCNDVIEHMSDPMEFLKSVRRKLRPGGKLIASVPNLRFAPLLFDLVFRGEFDYQEFGPLDYTHLHLFTLRSFSKMAERCGWKVDVAEPINIQPFKPWNNLILKILEHGRKDMRSAQFAVRLSPRAD